MTTSMTGFRTPRGVHAALRRIYFTDPIGRLAFRDGDSSEYLDLVYVAFTIG
jgi:hypothetical protein